MFPLGRQRLKVETRLRGMLRVPLPLGRQLFKITDLLTKKIKLYKHTVCIYDVLV